MVPINTNCFGLTKVFRLGSLAISEQLIQSTAKLKEEISHQYNLCKFIFIHFFHPIPKSMWWENMDFSEITHFEKEQLLIKAVYINPQESLIVFSMLKLTNEQQSLMSKST